MADEIMTLAEALALLPDNTLRLISPQKARDVLVSTWGALATRDPTTDDDADGNGGAGAFDEGSKWFRTDNPNRGVWVCFDGMPHAAQWRKLYPPPSSLTNVLLTMPAPFNVVNGAPGNPQHVDVTFVPQTPFAVLAGPAWPFDPIATGLRSWWQLDELTGDRADSYGPNTAINNGGVGTGPGVSSVTGTASTFNGTAGRFLQAATSPTLDVGANDFAVATWFKTSSGTAQSLVSRGGEGFPGYEIEVRPDLAGRMLAQLFDNAGHNVNFTNDHGNWIDGAWHLAILVVDRVANHGYFIVDNVPDAVPNSIAAFGANPMDAVSGFRFSGWVEVAPGTFPLNGSMQDTALFVAPPGGIAGVIASLSATLWNGGNGTRFTPAAAVPTFRLLVQGDVPSLNAAKIVDGVFAVSLLPPIPVSLLTGPGTISPSLFPSGVVRDEEDNISATGTTQGTAFVLSKSSNRVTSSSALQNGVILFTGTASLIVIECDQTNAFLTSVYPPVGEFMNGVLNAPVTQGPGTTHLYVNIGSHWYVI